MYNIYIIYTYIYICIYIHILNKYIRQLAYENNECKIVSNPIAYLCLILFCTIIVFRARYLYSLSLSLSFYIYIYIYMYIFIHIFVYMYVYQYCKMTPYPFTPTPLMIPVGQRPEPVDSVLLY